MDGAAVEEPVVGCPRCGGRAFVLAECECRRYGDRAVVTDRAEGGAAFRNCRVCRGVGEIRRECELCAGVGRIRAQLVYTVVNVDTGVVASANLVPGVLEVERAPDGRRALAAGAVLRDLAARAGAVMLCRFPDDDVEQPDGDGLLELPGEWRPHLEPADRLALEAEAIVRAAGCGRWQVWWGRSRRPATPDPDALLAHWCALAERLLVDLVIERRADEDDGSAEDRRWCWTVRFALPGAPLPARAGVFRDREWLSDAIVRHTDRDLLGGLASAGTAPARFVRPAAAVPAAEPMSVARLDEALDQCRLGAAGAVATWRDGRWHVSPVRREGSTPVVAEESSGQIRTGREPVFRREHEPPPASYDGGPIPERACPSCRDDPFPASDPLRACRDCGGTGAIRYGAAVTVVDLASPAGAHLNWSVPERPVVRPVAVLPGGTPVVRLSEDFRLDGVAARLGIDPARLTGPELAGHRFTADLREGVVACGTFASDAYVRYLVKAGHGRDGGRIFVLADPAPAPGTVERLLVVALGLGLHVEVAAGAYPPGDDPGLVHGLHWSVEVVPAGRPVTDLAAPYGRTLPDAAADAWRFLGGQVHGAAGRAGPLHRFPVPQQARPVPPDLAGLATALPRIADAHQSGSTVGIAMARFTGGGCLLFAGDYRETRRLAAAASLPAALADAGIRP